MFSQILKDLGKKKKTGNLGLADPVVLRFQTAQPLVVKYKRYPES